MFIVLESEIITLMISQNYDSNISRLLNTYKTLTKQSIIWSSAPLNVINFITTKGRFLCVVYYFQENMKLLSNNQSSIKLDFRAYKELN